MAILPTDIDIEMILLLVTEDELGFSWFIVIKPLHQVQNKSVEKLENVHSYISNTPVS